MDQQLARVRADLAGWVDVRGFVPEEALPWLHTAAGMDPVTPALDWPSDALPRRAGCPPDRLGRCGWSPSCPYPPSSS
ncbi:hypothetical protein [Actinopolymorpha pittospori]|uniref:Uncharacterized protein n=1 Tax=Actinopolymorpha pittospori TaxID=648752 RepID=A0A927N2L0_9ACTN|nr:hypothetical protein [Actinopolymorpha pittospori]MBE1610919.1 hypothetical protein [Actinopolymorpha pittospori]